MKWLFCFIFWPSFSFAKAIAIPIYKTPDYQYTALKYPDFQLIAFTGGFHPLKDQNPLRGLIQKLDPDKPVVLWVLNSPGGYSDAFVQTMRSLKAKAARVEVIVSGYCASACTFLGALGDDTHLVAPEGRMVVHRTWAFRSHWTLQTPQQMAAMYGRLGANENWFLRNLHVLKAPRNEGVTLTSAESLQAGLADEVVGVEDLHRRLGSDVVQAVQKAFADFP